MTLAEAPAVIFCTAFEEHAVQAFELQAVGYLLKPVRRADLFRALANSARLNRIQLDAVKNVNNDRRTHLSARTYKGVELVNISDIRYLKADQKYVSVRYTGGEVIVDETLRELEEEFPDLFSRVHRNALVTTNHIMGLEKDAKGQIGVRMSDVEELIDVSRRHLPAIRKVIRRL
jgi:two-component system response regulator AlgR